MKVNNAVNVPIKRIMIGMTMWSVGIPYLTGTHFDMVRMSTGGMITDTANTNHKNHRYLFSSFPSVSHRESATVSNAMEGEIGSM